jgi:hypothetical protein
MATIQAAADWQKQWFEIADATYLNIAAHAATPASWCQAFSGEVRKLSVGSGNSRIVRRRQHYLDNNELVELSVLR